MNARSGANQMNAKLIKSVLLTMCLALAWALSLGHAHCNSAQAATPVVQGGETGTYAILPFDTSVFAGTYPAVWWAAFQPNFVNGVASMLTTEMSKSGLHIVERDKIDPLLKEQGFQASGQVAPDSAVKLGKLLGARFLVTGSITEWKMYEQRTGIGAFSVTKTVAKCDIDFHVIDVETGLVVLSDTARGKEEKTSVGFGPDWFQNLTGQNNQWMDSQIGKATRKAVRDIVAKMLDKKPDEMVIADIDQDDAFVEIDENSKLRKGDRVEIYRYTGTRRNKQGKVIYKKPELLGHAEVVDVQESGAKLHITDRVSGAADITSGCLVKRMR
jgi:curli biogenesis system outer membrane secretion channel CsgG